MDRIDHALGRPLDPLRPSYRNYYATGEVEGFGPPHWRQIYTIGSDMNCYEVTDAGRIALARHLHQLGNKQRLYLVAFDGIEISIAAESRAQARYTAWLRFSDICPDLDFRTFIRRANVSPATPSRRFDIRPTRVRLLACVASLEEDADSAQEIGATETASSLRAVANATMNAAQVRGLLPRE